MDNENAVLAVILSTALLVTATLIEFVWGCESERADAVKNGAAEYYVDPGETIRKFRYLPGKKLPAWEVEKK